MFRNPIVRDFLTGLFALSAVAGFCALLILFGEITDLGAKYYRFQVILPSAAGLGPTSPVTVNGVKVGQVVKAEVAPQGAALTLKIRDGVKIPKDSTLSIEKGLIGDASLEFAIGAADVAALNPSALFEEGSVVESKVTGSFFDRLAESIQKPLDRLSSSADRIDKLADTWTATGVRINELLEARTLADVESGKPANVASTIARIDAAVASADRWMNDDQLRAGVKDTLTRAGATMDDLRKFLEAWTATADSVDLAAQKLEGAAGSIDKHAAELTAEAVQTLRHVDAAAAELAKTIESANKGEGTVGQLLTNPDLYKSLTSSSQRLEKVLTELQLLVEKFRAEGVQIKL
ncbi:hypothetical protein PHYC_01877 [Phycisphaerales bacterium]|nr:hypothetical protein PHYC_01877 [Phycisphaerales bacterium]